ncbi:HugZ family protein [Pannonibacter indicus]|uniref:Putative heme iron utilization protein n=1 Tax=Pannonibacter indicus TaxID=466044 RepID=A0A0K6HLU4_9HYPH|nr:DUF2470 domain-containing protein [Pannonibacter indicus]CUA92017.1 Putative heme iron utilization protein [Pannonibacter indicus]
MTEAGKEKALLQEVDDEVRRQARSLLRLARHAALGVLEVGTGHPLVSRVTPVAAMDGTPVVLASKLAAHKPAMLADGRCSLLVGEPGKGDPLAHPRMTVMAVAREIERGSPDHDEARRRHLARHPKAGLYLDFPDMSFFRLEVARASLNGGFGKAHALSAADLVLAADLCAPLSGWEAGAVAHMNEDHADALALYAQVLCGQPRANWRLTGLDPEGLDLAAGDRVCRLWFDTPLTEPKALREKLVELAKAARAKAPA